MTVHTLNCIDCPETFTTFDDWARHDRMESAIRFAQRGATIAQNSEERTCEQCHTSPDTTRTASVLRLNVEYRSFFVITTCSERCEAAWIRAYHASMPAVSASF